MIKLLGFSSRLLREGLLSEGVARSDGRTPGWVGLEVERIGLGGPTDSGKDRDLENDI